MRFWVSWWTRCEEWPDTPYQFWESGIRDLDNASSVCAMIDGEDTQAIWEAVERDFPDYEERFCDLTISDAQPGDRFPGWQNRTACNWAKEDIG